MRTLLRASLPFVFGVAAACGARTAGPGDPAGDQARLVVENRSSLDMDIEAIRQRDQAIRVGFVPAGQTATFRLAPGLLAGASMVIFQARPVRGAGQRVRSDPMVLTAGEEITWSIPPQ